MYRISLKLVVRVAPVGLVAGETLVVSDEVEVGVPETEWGLGISDRDAICI